MFDCIVYILLSGYWDFVERLRCCWVDGVSRFFGFDKLIVDDVALVYLLKSDTIVR